MRRLSIIIFFLVIWLSLVSFLSFTKTQTQARALPQDSATPTPTQFSLPTPTIITVTTQLTYGWNLINMPVRKDMRYLAERFLQNINDQKGECTEIDKFENGTWVGHIFGYPFNNYPIYDFVGYFIRCNKPSTWSETGEANKPEWAYYSLNQGWNLIAYPVPAGFHPIAGGQFYAESFLEYLNTPNPNIKKNNCNTVKEIDRFVAGSWKGHILGFPFNNFPIKINEAYFVRCEGSTGGIQTIPILPTISPTLTPTKKPIPTKTPTPTARWRK